MPAIASPWHKVCRQHGDDPRVRMKRPVADDAAAPPVEVEHRREAEVDAMRTKLRSKYVAERGGDATGLQYVAVPKFTQAPHRRQARKASAEPLHASAFVVDRDQQRGIAQRVDFGRQPAKLLRGLEVAREQDHHADQRMCQPIAIFRGQLQPIDADDHGANRHAPSSASAMAYAMANRRSSVMDTCSFSLRPCANCRSSTLLRNTMGRPEGSLTISTARHDIGLRMPSPSALEMASLAAKRVARNVRPRSSERARRAW